MALQPSPEDDDVLDVDDDDPAVTELPPTRAVPEVRLNERHARVLRLRMQGKSLQAIADELGVTRERIRQMEAKALRILRQAIWKRLDVRGWYDVLAWMQSKGHIEMDRPLCTPEPRVEVVERPTEFVTAIFCWALRNDTRPIEALDLSPRAYNALKRGQIRTVGDVARLTVDEVLAIRNVGTKSLDELSRALAGREPSRTYRDATSADLTEIQQDSLPPLQGQRSIFEMMNNDGYQGVQSVRAPGIYGIPAPISPVSQEQSPVLQAE